MSTYNGIKFLKAQIDSILNQNEVDINLIIRDDGSSDGTIELLDYYSENDQRITILPSKQNLGPACSFMELLYSSVDAEYYAFSDQDDIWNLNKLVHGVKMIDNIAVPCLYCSNQTIYIDNVDQGDRFTENPSLGLVNAICGNMVSGCTFIINKKLRDILINETLRPSRECLRKRMHDTWVIAVAECVGKVLYDHKSFIHYRIHENNTVGINTSKLDRFKQILKKQSNKYGRSCLAKELLKLDQVEQLDVKKREIIKSFAERNFIKLVTNKDIKNECSEKRIIFVLKAFFRWV